jgi:CheY-like chemotaxis protein
MPPTILVVEDDDFQRRLLAQVLESENYRTRFAASGAEALNCLSRLRPDLILMDLHIPDVDGMEVMRHCKTTPQLAGIPVIMITGSAELETVLKSREVGAADSIVKPFERSTLLAKVGRILNGQVGIGWRSERTVWLSEASFADASSYCARRGKSVSPESS